MLKLKEFKKHFPMETKFFEREQEENYINPLSIFESIYFRDNNCKDYRNTAINKCIEEKISFTSSENNIYNLAKRFVFVKCPLCEEFIQGYGGGGTVDYNYIDYKCKCGFKATLNMHNNGIFFEFKDNEHKSRK